MRASTVALLCLTLPACILTLDEDGDGPPPGTPYCGDGMQNGTETCDDGNAISGDGCSATCVREGAGATITASWTFRNEATGTTTGCPAGFDTVALYNQEVTSAGLTIGSPIIDLFDCATGSGASAPLPPTTFKTWIEVTNTNNTSQYATSTVAFVDVSVSDKSFSAQILNDGGYFYFQWSLIGASSNADLTCAQAGAAGGIEAIATDVSDGSNSATDRFTCEDLSAYSAGYRAATYTFSVSALNAADQSIGTAPALTNKTIAIHNAITNLGLIEIPITGL
jgi:cysteine-rich repeat protein